MEGFRPRAIFGQAQSFKGEIGKILEKTQTSAAFYP
jgi:hypothetical protein